MLDHKGMGRFLAVALVLLCAVSGLHSTSGASEPTSKKVQGKSKLKRTEAKRWQHIKEIALAEIKSQTQKFLSNRDQSLLIPTNVDIVLIGFSQDGAYGYSIRPTELEELLAASVNTHCPSVWETREQTAMCFAVSFIVIDPDPSSDNLIQSMESVIKYAMKEAPNEKGLNLHNVEAKLLEPSLNVILEKVYMSHGFQSGAWRDRDIMIILNPSKRRMDPRATPEQLAVMQKTSVNVIEEWKQGRMTLPRVLEEEAGFTYRYTYNGAGGAAAWVSSENYLVVDISAGPANFGPTSSPNGNVMAVDVPRLEMMLSRLLREAEETPAGTLHEKAVQDASEGQHKLFVGELGALITSACQHVFLADLFMDRIEDARSVMVPVLFLQDHVDFDVMDHTQGGLDVAAVQHAVSEMVGAVGRQNALVSTAQLWVHTHKQVVTSLHKARYSRSEAVVLNPPETGYHADDHEYLDGDALLKELHMAADLLLQGLITQNPDRVHHRDPKAPGSDLASQLRHEGTRYVPVFVLSLKSTPAAMMFEDRSFFTASHDAVVVLQLMGRGDAPDGSHVFSGHQVEGAAHYTNSKLGVTRNVIAGLAQAIAGLVPPFQRYDPLHGGLSEDWRWGQGALPWGPYTNYSGISSSLVRRAQRNVVISHVEGALRQLQLKLDAVDVLVSQHLAGPFDAIAEELSESVDRSQPKELHHFLDAVAGRAHGYNETLTPNMVQRLAAHMRLIETDLLALGESIFFSQHVQIPDQIQKLLKDVDQFTDMVEHDLQQAYSIVNCCEVEYRMPWSLQFMVIASAIFMILVFAALVVLVVMSPPGSGSARRKALGRSLRRSNEPVLPSWNV